MPCYNYSIRLSNWMWIQVPGGKRKEQKKKGIAVFFLVKMKQCIEAHQRPGCRIEPGLAQWMPTPTPPHSLPPPPAYFPAGIHLGTHMGATTSVPHEQGGRVPSLNSPDALACQPSDLSQAEAKPPESKTNIHSELIDFFPLFSNENNKKNTI